MYRLLVLLFVVVTCVICIPVKRNHTLLENPDLFEGDIVLTSDQLDRNSAVKSRLWPNGVIYYELSDLMKPYEEDIRKTMDYIEKVTCITFKKRTPEDTNYMYILSGKGGCFSYVGQKKGEQLLSLKIPGCLDSGVILHEITHAIGFYHEHSRYDRDEYVEIHWENVKEQFKSQFRKLDEKEADTYNSFDYHSIMLYGETVFSKDIENDLKTMTAKKPGVTIEGPYGRTEYSASDIYRIKKMYDC